MGPTSDAVKIKSGLDRLGPRGKNLICFLFLTTEFMENMENTRIVSKNKIKIDEMINAHWAYVESVIRTSSERGLYIPPMTLDEALKIREFDYKTAAKHFYGHGHEDGSIDMAKTTLERLRK